MSKKKKSYFINTSKNVNDYMKLHIYSGGQTRPLTETSTKERGENKRGTKVSFDHKKEHSS